jgi:branched-chain amino acid transport system permease protein
MPVYGQHLKQILITMGGLIVAEQLIHVDLGRRPEAWRCPPPARLIVFGDVAIEKFRLLAVAVGLSSSSPCCWCSTAPARPADPRRRREREMVEALGYRIRRLFVGVFVAGSALAGLGGVLWGSIANADRRHRREVMVLVFIVIIIGGLGSVGGCFIGAILVALMANYTGFLAPKVALPPTSC